MGIASYRKIIPIVIDDKFPLWAIVTIGVGCLLICIVVIVCCVIRAKKKRLAMAANGYNRFNDTKGTNAFLPNSQLD